MSTFLLTNKLWKAVVEDKQDWLSGYFLRVVLLLFTAPFLWLILIQTWMDIFIYSRKNKLNISDSILPCVRDKRSKIK